MQGVLGVAGRQVGEDVLLTYVVESDGGLPGLRAAEVDGVRQQRESWPDCGNVDFNRRTPVRVHEGMLRYRFDSPGPHRVVVEGEDLCGTAGRARLEVAVAVRQP